MVILYLIVAVTLLHANNNLYAYLDEHKIEKNDNYYQYFFNNQEQMGIMEREESRLQNMMMREMRDTDNNISRKNNAELECIRKGDDYKICREKYGY